MSNLDPSGPSQPTLNTAYDQPANPSSTTEAEDRKGSSTAASQQRSAPVQETRQQNDVLPDGDKDQEYVSIRLHYLFSPSPYYILFPPDSLLLPRTHPPIQSSLTHRFIEKK